MITPFESAAKAAVATRLAPGTRAAYGRALGRWLAACAEAGADPSDPPADLAAAHRNALSAAGLKGSTVRDHLAALSFVYKRLVARRPPAAAWNPFDPSVLAWPPASAHGSTEEVPEEVVARILTAVDEAAASGHFRADLGASDLRDRAFLRLLFATGARRMTIVTMRRDGLRKREHVDRETGEVTERTVARVKTKGSGGEALSEIALPEEAAAALGDWLAVAPAAPYVFPSRDRRGAMDLSMANKILTRWARAAGVTAAQGSVHPHRARVSFITRAFDLGLPWRDVQASVGHADPRSTQRYDRGLRGGGVAEAVAKSRRKKEEDDR